MTWRDDLLGALGVIAADADGRRAWRERRAVPADEIGPVFDDAYRMALEGESRPRTLSVLDEIDAVPTAPTAAGPARWGAEALSTDPAWCRTRRALAVAGQCPIDRRGSGDE